MRVRIVGRREFLVATVGVLMARLTAAQSASDVVRSRSVAVRGVTLHYVDQGQGPAVVLLHGGQADYRAWPQLMSALAPRFRAIAYSRRHHFPNNNPFGPPNHSAVVDAEDLAALLAELGTGPVHLVGTSYGALTALTLAARQPASVRSLVLAEPPLLRWIEHQPRGAVLVRDFMKTVMEPAADAFRNSRPDAAMRIFVDRFDGGGTFDSLPAERRAAVLQNARFFEALVSSSDPFPDLPQAPLAALAIPTLLIRGANTDEMHRLVVEQAALVLKTELLVIPNAGHGSPRQNPAFFNAAVLAFLDRQRRP